MKIVITGSIENYKRNDIKKLIIDHKGDVTSSVSKNTDLVLCGEKPGSKKEKADQLGIKILEDEELFEFIRKLEEDWVDKNEVFRIYKLANLDLSNQDVDLISDKYNKILDFIDHIFDVDCKDVKMTEMLDDHEAILREDVPGGSLDREDALKNAKDTEYGYFRLDWKL